MKKKFEARNQFTASWSDIDPGHVIYNWFSDLNERRKKRDFQVYFHFRSRTFQSDTFAISNELQADQRALRRHVNRD